VLPAGLHSLSVQDVSGIVTHFPYRGAVQLQRKRGVQRHTPFGNVSTHSQEERHGLHNHTMPHKKLSFQRPNWHGHSRGPCAERTAVRTPPPDCVSNCARGWRHPPPVRLQTLPGPLPQSCSIIRAIGKTPVDSQENSPHETGVVQGVSPVRSLGD
jgi:hypothetical protein